MRMRTVLLLWAAACSAVGGSDAQYRTSAGPVRAVTVASGLSHPWALAFLPDRRMLVTERDGRMRIVGPDGTLGAPLAGLPRIEADGQGGLLDVVLDHGHVASGPAGDDELIDLDADPILGRPADAMKLQAHPCPLRLPSRGSRLRPTAVNG